MSCLWTHFSLASLKYHVSFPLSFFLMLLLPTSPVWLLPLQKLHGSKLSCLSMSPWSLLKVRDHVRSHFQVPSEQYRVQLRAGVQSNRTCWKDWAQVLRLQQVWPWPHLCKVLSQQRTAWFPWNVNDGPGTFTEATSHLSVPLRPLLGGSFPYREKVGLGLGGAERI